MMKPEKLREMAGLTLRADPTPRSRPLIALRLLLLALCWLKE